MEEWWEGCPCLGSSGGAPDDDDDDDDGCDEDDDDGVYLKAVKLRISEFTDNLNYL